jgi:hypothetical protein
MQLQIQENENTSEIIADNINVQPAPIQTSITFNKLKRLQSLIKEEAASRELCIYLI